METRVHVSLEVSDLKQSIAFYSKLFQREPTKIKEDYANFRMELPQLHLALVENPKRSIEPPSNRHYGIELFADEKLNQWLKELEKSGLKARVEEQITCCYATANKFWIQDPDGHEWEFWVRHAEAESMHGEAAEIPKLETKKKTACCAPGQC